MKTKAILCDIEGTTTDIHFVHKVLFPYSQKRLHSFVTQHLEQERVKNIIKGVQSVAKIEKNSDLDLEGVIEQLDQWIKEDRKESNLKTLQGLIWEEGYKSGELLSHVYEDVPLCFKQWKKNGLDIHIYSSGSVHAQKLLFKYTIAGDLTPYISEYFDTMVGPKRVTESYQKIAQLLKLDPSSLLFLSDISLELDAAKEAGLQTTQLLRSPDIVPGNHFNIRHFDQVKLDE